MLRRKACPEKRGKQEKQNGVQGEQVVVLRVKHAGPAAGWHAPYVALDGRLSAGSVGLYAELRAEPSASGGRSGEQNESLHLSLKRRK
jgi:hypothetical protein